MSDDNSTNDEVLRELLECFRAWEPSARILGNVRACDAIRAIEALKKERDENVRYAKRYIFLRDNPIKSRRVRKNELANR